MTECIQQLQLRNREIIITRVGTRGRSAFILLSPAPGRTTVQEIDISEAISTIELIFADWERR
jgi:hypothetical protein